MEAWAQASFGEGPGSLESLFEFCGAYPHTGLPDVLGRRYVTRKWGRQWHLGMLGSSAA